MCAVQIQMKCRFFFLQTFGTEGHHNVEVSTCLKIQNWAIPYLFYQYALENPSE